eukprot:Clim_evm31s25 gene=Clim_evmTU31s25
MSATQAVKPTSVVSSDHADAEVVKGVWGGKLSQHDSWDKIMYSEKFPYMVEARDRESELLRQILDEHVETYGEVAVVDVGCSSGEALLRMQANHKAKYCYGIDINPAAVQAGNRRPEFDSANCQLIHGDATRMSEYMPEGYQKDEPPHIVMNLGNTFGILYGPVRKAILESMCDLVGEKGTLVLSVYNGEKFDFAMNTFYPGIQDLSGPFDKTKHANPGSCEIRNDNGYYSHWWHEEELRDLLEPYGLVVDYVERFSTHYMLLTARRVKAPMAG